MITTWVEEGPTLAAKAETVSAGDRMIAALLQERADLARRDLPDRVAQVDESLRHYGYDGTGPAAATEQAGGR